MSLKMLMILACLVRVYVSNDWSLYLSDNQTRLNANSINLFHLNGIEEYNSRLIEINMDGTKISDIGLLRQFSNLINLSLTSNLISNIEPLSNLIKLKELDLSENQISNIQPLVKLINLEILKINSNKIKSIDCILNNLLNLGLFFAIKNQICDIEIRLANKSKLENLQLETNRIQSFKNVGYLSNLKLINLFDNQIEKLDETFVNLAKLIDLNIGKNKISNIDVLSELNILENVFLDSNQIKNACVFGQNSQLSSIFLNENLIENIDCFLNKYNSLTHVRVETNAINAVNFNKLSFNKLDLILDNNIRLREINVKNDLHISFGLLSLRNCNLIDLSFMMNISDVVNIDLSFNKITNIDLLRNFSILVDIEMSDNLIENVSSLANLANLKRLVLSNNRVKSLDDVRTLTKMAYLEANSNHLTDLKFIKHLTRLTYLYLSNNQIEIINESMIFDDDMKFEKMKIMDLSKNKLKSFEFNRFSNIVHLNLSHNQIQMDLNLTYLTNLTKLVSIDLSFNKIKMSKNEVQNSSFINNDLNFVHIDTNLVELFVNVKRNILAKENGNHKYLKTLYIVTNNDLNHGDCLLKIDYMRRNIHLNMYYYDQVETFFSKCQFIDLNL